MLDTFSYTSFTHIWNSSNKISRHHSLKFEMEEQNYNWTSSLIKSRCQLVYFLSSWPYLPHLFLIYWWSTLYMNNREDKCGQLLQQFKTNCMGCPCHFRIIQVDVWNWLKKKMVIWKVWTSSEKFVLDWCDSWTNSRTWLIFLWMHMAIYSKLTPGSINYWPDWGNTITCVQENREEVGWSVDWLRFAGPECFITALVLLFATLLHTANIQKHIHTYTPILLEGATDVGV